MPIFYRDRQRVLFVHVPKAAGTSVLLWLCDNGWRVTNHVAHAGFSRELLERRYGSASVPTEGVQPRRVPPQHAERAVFAQWGTFDYAFVLVREPIARLRSHVAWIDARARATGEHLPAPERFANAYLRQALDNVERDPAWMDNHLRRQADFLDPTLEVLHYEDDWPARLRERLGLAGPVPRVNTAPDPEAARFRLEPDLAERVLDFYGPDFEVLDYPCPDAAELTRDRGTGRG